MKKRLILAFLLAALRLAAEDEHQKMVDQRGDHVMGFSHEKTTHHFRLFSNGGAIEVSANDPKDTDSRDEIRMHLSHIASMFTGGNFNAPMSIHDPVPPEVPALRRLKSEVRYRYENTERGGRVRITTDNKEALAAVHEFLKFQIADHQTGDTTEISNPSRGAGKF